MRWLASGSFVLFVLGATFVRVPLVVGQAPDAAPKGIEQTTTVTGTAPDLLGRWLVLPLVGVAGGDRRVVPSVWDVHLKDGQLEITERLVLLPAAQAAAVQQANEERNGAWDPTPADLDAIRSGWDTLVPEERGIVSMTHQVTGRDAYDDDFKNDASAKDSIWAVRQSYGFESGGNRPITQANLIAPLKFEDGIYSGNYLAVTIAAAPFPVPIKFEGTFRMIPLVRSAPSLWQKVGDLFAGCHKR